MHLGMSGSFRIEAAGDARSPLALHDHVVFDLESGARVIFTDPRRFGFMDLLTVTEREQHPVLSRLGPEPLSAEFDGWALARACRGKKTSLKAALLDQRVVAGLGNIYASEALHVARLSPRRRAGILATPTGTPRDSAHRLAAAIKQVLNEAIARGVRPAIPLVALPRLRSGRSILSPAHVRRCRPAGYAGRTLDVLLSRLSALTRGSHQRQLISTSAISHQLSAISRQQSVFSFSIRYHQSPVSPIPNPDPSRTPNPDPDSRFPGPPEPCDTIGHLAQRIERPPRRRRSARPAVRHHLSRSGLHLGGRTAHAGGPGDRPDRVGMGDGHVHARLLSL